MTTSGGPVGQAHTFAEGFGSPCPGIRASRTHGQALDTDVGIRCQVPPSLRHPEQAPPVSVLSIKEALSGLTHPSA